MRQCEERICEDSPLATPPSTQNREFKVLEEHAFHQICCYALGWEGGEHNSTIIATGVNCKHDVQLKYSVFDGYNKGHNTEI